ncbi:hypothetical protein ACTHGU_15640 [Chitinophagaceae bacterium MMS25-I14]
MNRCGTDKEIQLFTSAQELPDIWNQLAGDHFLSAAQLLINEQAALPDIQHYYTLVYYKGRPAAIAFFQLLSLNDRHVSRHGTNALLHGVWRTYSGLTRPKLLIAGHLFRHDISSFLTVGSLPPYESYLCYRAAINAAQDKSCASAILVKDVAPSLINYFLQYAPQYMMLRNDISMEMEIPGAWESFEDYEKALKHKYAQKVRKVRHVWNGLEIKELSAEDTEKNEEQIYRLYRQTAEHQQVRLGFLSPGFMTLLRGFYETQLKIWAVYENGAMVAFLSAWVKDDVFDMFYIGFDYSRNAALQLYFNILYFSLEQAIRFKKKKLILGRTALDAKARLGCTPHYLHTFLYIRNPLLRNYVLRMQQQMSAEESSWEQKHPFKK